MVIAELSIFPVGKGMSLSPYVARAVKVIKDSGIKHEFHSMGTILEGEWDDVIDVVNGCYAELNKDCERIVVNFKADCKKGKSDLMKNKVESVESKL